MSMMDNGRECVALGECRPRHRSRKDTRRWCRGRAGVEHVWTLVCGDWKDRDDVEHGYRNEHEVCVACGRDRKRFWWFDDDRVVRCHCGQLMRRPRGRWRWSSGPWTCGACGYVPSSCLIQVWRDGRYVCDPPRTPCACEIASVRERNRERGVKHNLSARADADD